MIARLLQGVGIGAAAVVGFLIPRDLFSSKKATQSLSLMGLLTVSTPAIAPLIGGQIQIYFVWRMSLTLIAALCLILLFLMLFYFKETLPNEQRLRNRLSEVFHNYGKMLKHQTFMSYTILTPLLFTAELCYFTILPFYFINQLGFEPNIFGIYLSLIICAYLLASIFMPKLIAVFNPDKLIKTGILLSIISCIGLVICASTMPENIILIAIMLALHQFSMALIFSPALTAILDIFPQNKGSVSALRNSLLTAGAALGSFAGTVMPEDILIQMSIFMLVPSLCCYWAFSKRKSSAQTS